MAPSELKDAATLPPRPAVSDLGGAALAVAWLVFALAYVALAQIGFL
ncbi:MAG: hypothetical protein RLZ44_933, partial [Pseudomonadota bacterium]